MVKDQVGDKTRENLSRKLGMDVDEFQKLSLYEQVCYLEQRNEKTMGNDKDFRIDGYRVGGADGEYEKAHFDGLSSFQTRGEFDPEMDRMVVYRQTKLKKQQRRENFLKNNQIRPQKAPERSK